ncbi:MAG TPA: VCBS repeat-containing protein [Bacteroidales bacterium]|nr:VCBS repeat-containing protein [Bacteroidales bacterium]
MRIYSLLCLTWILFFSCGRLNEGTFRKLSPSGTGIDFNNQVTENDTLNYMIFPYMYMGGGVSVGDINNDGLDDIFFTGNLVHNRLYLNKGNMKFEDISEKAGVSGNHQWFTGSTMADVNNDGWLDIYVCVSSKYKPSDNLLFINNKNNTFTECAKAYGINDQSSSVQSAFFDYNNDGLLDLFVANYPIVLVSMGADFYHKKMIENKYEESGHLYKNNGNGTFTDVTTEAGVQNFGMSIGVIAVDLNNDGWKDLYVSNDFNVPDCLYLNNGNGTFRNVIKEAASQISIFGMGIDAADINNDGLTDLFQIDMTPEDHFRRMVNVIPMSHQTFNRSLEYGLHYQYMQNSLQLNNGIFNNTPIFSNISLYAGVAYTDWSWGGLFMDIDNDGNKDLFVTNGVLKDINNRDIMDNPRENMYFKSKEVYSPELFPSTPVKNYVFKNNGDFTFTNKTDSWGFGEMTMSNGISYGDFDNDGDLDLVINNANELSYLYENKIPGKNAHYIKIKLAGPAANLFGLGSIVTAETGNIHQKQELTLTRGYQSSAPPVIYFGLGDKAIIDKLTITWPDSKRQILKHVNADQTLILNYNDAVIPEQEKTAKKSAFIDITRQAGITFLHRENKFDDFEYEKMLPYKNSQMGPGLAIGDVNGDGLEDFYVGNGKGFKGAMYLQSEKAVFSEAPGPWISDSLYEDTGALMFDADKDGRLDLYVVSGGNNNREKEEYYEDRLYLNTEKGFVRCRNCLPAGLYKSGKCVKAADYDKDGHPDLFVGGRIVPGKYPWPADSYLLRNNGGKGTDLKFENVTEKTAPGLSNSGLVTDAAWDDFDGDGSVDLIVVGEWMNIHFLDNTPEGFIDVTDKWGLGETTGWWNCIYTCDIDGDGDNDYLAGNLGLNYKYKSSEKEPFEIYSNDFDLNGTNDIVLGYWEKGRNYPVNGLDASAGQIPVIGLRYKSYEEFAKATLQDIYGDGMLKASLHYKINTFANSWIENKGKEGFAMHNLPDRAQFSSINDFAEVKYKNNSISFIAAGNLYGSEIETPRNDGSIGLVLQPGPREEIIAVPPDESTFIIRGEVKAIRKIKLATGKDAFLFALNNDSLKLIEPGFNP